MTDWQVGQRWVHHYAKWCGVGVVRYVEGGKAFIRWANDDLDVYAGPMQQYFRPAPDFPRVYQVDNGYVRVWLTRDTEVCIRDGWRFINMKFDHANTSLGKPLSNGTWDHHEITGTPEADEFIRQAEAYFAEKDKSAPAPLPTPEEVAEQVDLSGLEDHASCCKNCLREYVAERLADAIRTDRERRGAK